VLYSATQSLRLSAFATPLGLSLQYCKHSIYPTAKSTDMAGTSRQIMTQLLLSRRCKRRRSSAYLFSSQISALDRFAWLTSVRSDDVRLRTFRSISRCHVRQSSSPLGNHLASGRDIAITLFAASSRRCVIPFNTLRPQLLFNVKTNTAQYSLRPTKLIIRQVA
jgi:hypothetical protein